MSSETDTRVPKIGDKGVSETSVDTLENNQTPGLVVIQKLESVSDIPSEENVPVAPERKRARKNLAPKPPAFQTLKDNEMETTNPPEYEPRAEVQKPKAPETFQVSESPEVQNNQNNQNHQHSNIQTSGTYLPMEVYATVVAASSFLLIGLMRAYTSPAIASMKEDHIFFNADNRMSKTIISWVAASPPLASFFGTILSGLTLQYCGRQKTLVLLTLPFISGWLLIGLAKNTAMVMIGRALTGLAAGFATSVAQLYVSECVRAKVRGFLGILPAMMLSLGILMGFTLSTINLEWQELALLMTCFPIILLLFAITLPESPSWLLMRGKDAEAIKSLKKLRSVHDQVGPKSDNVTSNSKNNKVINLEIEKELEEMKRVLKRHHRSTIEDGKEEPQDFMEFVFKDLLGKREIWFPVFISLSLMIFQQFTGANAVIFYLSLILAEAAPTDNTPSNSSFLSLETGVGGYRDHYNHSHEHGGLDPNVSSVIVGLVQFLSFIISLPLIDRLGRRILLIASAIFMIFPHVVFGIYFYVKMNPLSYIHVYKYESIIRHTETWLPLTCICFLLGSYSLGFSSIPFIIMSEIFPAYARSYMVAIASLVNHLTLFFIIRVFPTLIDWIGPHIMFWLFGMFCFLAAVHVAIVVPETKGKTLAEIELEFMGPRRNSNSSSGSSAGMDSDNGKKATDISKEGNSKSKGKKSKCNCKHENKKSNK